MVSDYTDKVYSFYDNMNNYLVDQNQLYLTGLDGLAATLNLGYLYRTGGSMTGNLEVDGPLSIYGVLYGGSGIVWGQTGSISIGTGISSYKLILASDNQAKIFLDAPTSSVTLLNALGGYSGAIEQIGGNLFLKFTGNGCSIVGQTGQRLAYIDNTGIHFGAFILKSGSNLSGLSFSGAQYVSGIKIDDVTISGYGGIYYEGIVKNSTGPKSDNLIYSVAGTLTGAMVSEYSNRMITTGAEYEIYAQGNSIYLSGQNTPLMFNANRIAIHKPHPQQFVYKRVDGLELTGDRQICLGTGLDELYTGDFTIYVKRYGLDYSTGGSTGGKWPLIYGRDRNETLTISGLESIWDIRVGQSTDVGKYYFTYKNCSGIVRASLVEAQSGISTNHGIIMLGEVSTTGAMTTDTIFTIGKYSTGLSYQILTGSNGTPLPIGSSYEPYTGACTTLELFNNGETYSGVSQIFEFGLVNSRLSAADRTNIFSKARLDGVLSSSRIKFLFKFTGNNPSMYTDTISGFTGYFAGNDPTNGVSWV